MEIAGRVVILTGAAGGLGVPLAVALAKLGARLVLSDREEARLALVGEACADWKQNITLIAGDLLDPTLDDRLCSAADALGGCDILINNAAIEDIGSFQDQAWERVASSIGVNLIAPMRLTHRLLPAMVTRGRGHIVNVASLAGLFGQAFNEMYAATKHGLVGFTRSMRSTFQIEGSPVSASVVCPGFVAGRGMYGEMQERTGVRASSWQVSSPEAVTTAIVDAIRFDHSLVVVNPLPVSVLCGLGVMLPRWVEQISHWIGAHKVSLAVARHRTAR